MKIGLITFHDTTNFGSLLQTYGLYKGVEKLGHSCEVIDYQCESICERELPKPKTMKFGLKAFIKQILFDEKRKKYEKLHSFLINNMTVANRCDVTNKHLLNDIYDRFLVGSDIVWGTDITNGDTTYFLDFVLDKNKKYAFSSSIGNEWSDIDKIRLKPYLSDFHRIAVREDESANWVEALTGNRPNVVCDPTMLLTAEDWCEITSHKYKNDNYVLIYFDSPKNECLNTAISYARANGLKVYFINYGMPRKGTTTVRPYKLEDFLSLILYAKRVFTASYHGMLFSIYFNKQFLYFNRSHKSRMNTVAKRLQLTSCEGNSVDINKLPVVDYNLVNQLVEKYRQDSYIVLQQMLSE